jgi:hypothetical protein
MSATVHAPVRSWARIHWATLVIIVLSMALAAALAVLSVNLVNRAVPVLTTTHSAPTGPLQPTDNGCQVARPGQPC